MGLLLVAMDFAARVSQLRHPAVVFAVAASPDARWLVCAGAGPNPVIVWTLPGLEPAWVAAPLLGWQGQLSALAFSPDSQRIAAADVWGGIWVWRMEDGALVSTKAAGAIRRTRRLSFAGQNAAPLPVVLSGSVNAGPLRCLSPDGQLVATSAGCGCVLTRYRGGGGSARKPVAALDGREYELVQAGLRAMAWSPDSHDIVLCTDHWAGVWTVATRALCVAPMPAAVEFVHDVAWHAASRTILLATASRSLGAVTVPDQPVLSRMATLDRDLPAWSEGERAPRAGDGWEWNQSNWGHEGARLEADGLLWYTDTHHSQGGSGAVQSYADFLAARPESTGAPVEIYRAIRRAVLRLLREREGS